MSEHQLILVDLHRDSLVILDGELLYAEDYSQRGCYNELHPAGDVVADLSRILDVPVTEVDLQGAPSLDEFLDRHSIGYQEQGECTGEWTYDEVVRGVLADLQKHDLDHVQTPGSVPE